MASWRSTPFCAARSPIDWARSYCGNLVSRVCEAWSRAGCWHRGSACFGNAKQAEFTRKNGFNINQPGCEEANVNAATITRQSKSNLALAFVSLGRERKRDITIFYAFCRVVDDIADSAELSVIEKRVRLANWRQMLRISAPDEPLLARDAGGNYFRSGNGFEHPAIFHLQRASRLLLPRRQRSWTGEHRNFRLSESTLPTICDRSWARLANDKHHSRRREGFSGRPHLSAAGRSGAVPLFGNGAGETTVQRALPPVDALRSGSRDRILHPRGS